MVIGWPTQATATATASSISKMRFLASMSKSASTLAPAGRADDELCGEPLGPGLGQRRSSDVGQPVPVPHGYVAGDALGVEDP